MMTTGVHTRALLAALGAALLVCLFVFVLVGSWASAKVRLACVDAGGTPATLPYAGHAVCLRTVDTLHVSP